MTSKIQYHYAPLRGDCSRYIDGVRVDHKDWSDVHATMNDFFELKRDEKIKLLKTINYGHEFFRGHSGRVDVYEMVAEQNK